ncbi:MAG: RNA helicase [Acidiferrobacteraceae bacterium]|nr:RNA helicase [Acidiferrobacteraceae bacterium]|tara:strand:+ start:1898 stop:3385 length:1488 start_codon:yes stop_codon:yes gene_type:complete
MNQPSIIKPKKENLTHLTDKRFDQFDLRPELLKGIVATGFRYCTEIQAQALPLVLEGTDIAGQAHTGTGKTATFLLAIYQRLLIGQALNSESEKSVRAIVLAPTRELAIQIHEDAKTLGAYTNLRLGLVYGGTAYQNQRLRLAEGVDILIGTPGRLIDYFKQGIFHLKNVEVIVLDEADRMFDLGFIRDIRYILRRMPPPNKRLNMLFSATLSYRIKELAYEHMNDPKTVIIESTTPVADRLIEQIYYPANNEKFSLLLGVMNQISGDRVLIFANTRNTCEQLGQWLNGHNYAVGVLSGDVPQRKREKLLSDFKNGQKRILVATDVAARGLHIPRVSHVFNYDLPQDPEDYVHRIGRTARAGESGYAISFACEEHALSLLDIESFIGHSLEKMEISENLLHRTQMPDIPSHQSKKKLGKQQDNSNQNKKKQKNWGEKKGGEKFKTKPVELDRKDHGNTSNNSHKHSKNSNKGNEPLTSNLRISPQRKKREIPAIG